MQTVEVYTDGGCHGNPGPGGWAAVLTCGPHRREVCGGVPATTNNRMELQAAIEALDTLKHPCIVHLHTDSQYLRDGVTKWLKGWKRNGWRTKTKEPVKNEDLWRQLDVLVSQHQVEWRWVKGHAGNDGNERCDQLAQHAIAEVKAKHTKAELKAGLQELKQNKTPATTGRSLSLDASSQ